MATSRVHQNRDVSSMYQGIERGSLQDRRQVTGDQ